MRAYFDQQYMQGAYLDVIGEERDEGLGQGVAEHELGADNQDLHGTTVRIRNDIVKMKHNIPLA